MFGIGTTGLGIGKFSDIVVGLFIGGPIDVSEGSSDSAARAVGVLCLRLLGFCSALSSTGSRLVVESSWLFAFSGVGLTAMLGSLFGCH